MNRTLLFAVILAVALPVAAQDVCPCVPTTHLWVIKSCDTWDCAASAFILSNGSGNTLVVPTASTDARWAVLELVPAGTATSSDPILHVDSYDGWTNASLRFETIDGNLKPMIVSAPDGRFLIVSRNAPEPRRRAVAR